MEWFRQESFWRDVGSRTLAAVFAAAIIYLGALLLGYVSKPNPWLIVVTLGLAILLGMRVQWLARDQLFKRRWHVYPFMVFDILLFGVVVVAASQGHL